MYTCIHRRFKGQVSKRLRSLSSSTTNQRDRHRPVLRRTTRDRIRSLSKKFDKPFIAHAAQTAGFIESQLKQAQAFVRGFWTRDGTQGKGPEMDAWWWTWNIALALTPAAMIAIGMELWGKPFVDRRSKDIEEWQRLKLGLAKQDGTQNPEISSTSTIEHYTGEEKPSVEELLGRLRRLESLVERRDRQHQSGIRNRIEDRLVFQERNNSEDGGKAKQIRKDEKAPSISAFHVIWCFAYENLKAKRDAMVELGKRLLSNPKDGDEPQDSVLDSDPKPGIPAKMATAATQSTEQAQRSARAAANVAAEAEIEASFALERGQSAWSLLGNSKQPRDVTDHGKLKSPNQ